MYYIYAGNVINSEHNTGVQRVVRRLSRAFIENGNDIAIVKLDSTHSKLEHINDKELQTLSKCNGPDLYVKKTFDIYKYDQSGNDWMIVPEVSWTITKILISIAKYLKLKIAFIFYDAIPLKLKDVGIDYKDHENYMTELALADAVIPISKYSHLDLLSFFLHNKKIAHKALIETIHLSGETHISSRKEVLSHIKYENFILCVGAYGHRKNQNTLIKAFSEFVKNNHSWKLVFAGHHVEKIGKFQNIIIVNNPTDQELDDLYRRCAFTIFPSTEEGFGLPIIESIWYGKPCVCANFGSMLEVSIGGGCLQVDVNNHIAIENSILSLVNNYELIQKIRNEAKNRHIKTWQEYATEISNYLSKIDCFVNVEKRLFYDIENILDKPIVAKRILDVVGPIVIGKKMINKKPVISLYSHVRKIDIPKNINEQINYAYNTILGRSADESGLKYFLSMIKSGKNIDTIKFTLLNSDEFINNNPEMAGMSDEDKLYNIERVNCKTIKLSICISTYNRASWLDFGLKNIYMQISGKRNDLEILVVDNESTDNTEEVCKKYLVNRNFRYIRNEKNVGMLGNLTVTANAAKGEYVWIIGDDDIVKKDAISMIINEINNTDISTALIYMNYSWTFAKNSEELIKSSWNDNVHKVCKNEIGTVRQFTAKTLNLFTAIYCIILRRDHAVRCFSQDTSGRPFSTLKTCIPTTNYILSEMINEKAIWIGTPTVVVNYNVSWNQYASLFILERFPEAFDLAESVGVDKKELDLLRVSMIPGFIGFFDELYNNDIHGNCDFFDPNRLIKRMGYLKEFKQIVPELKKIYQKARLDGNKYAQTEINWDI